MPQAAKHPKLPKHCQWWKGSIRVHIGVPKPLQATVGKTALLRSLGTKDPRLAEYTRLPVIHEFESRIEAARLAVNPANVAARITAPLRWTAFQNGNSVGLMVRGGTGMYSQETAPIPGSEVDRLVAERLARFYQQGDDIATLLKRVADAALQHPSINADRIITAMPVADAHEVVTFATLLEAWATYQTNKNTIDDYKAKFAAFGAYLVGKTHPRGMTDAEKSAYLTDTDAVAVTVDHAVAYLDELMRTKSAKTADNHFAALKAVFGFNAEPGRKLFRTGNVFAGIKTHLKSDPKNARLNFSPEDRDRLLRAAWESDCPVEKWCTLLSGFSGLRLSEIVEAHPRDVEVVEGLPVLRVRETYRAKDRPLKNAAAARTVPLHSSIAAGFLAYVATRKGTDELFPSLQPGAADNNRLGNSASKIVNAFIRAQGIDDPRLVFHSWRHSTATMLDALRAPRVPKALRFSITGHTLPKGEGDGYIHSAEPSLDDLRELAAIIERLPAP